MVRSSEEWRRTVLYGGDGPTQQIYREWGHEETVPGGDELYDLYPDQQESRNLIDEPDYANLRDDLDRRLEEWMRRTGDPLLEGEIPQPAPH